MINFETIEPGLIKMSVDGKIEKTDIEAAISTLEREQATSGKLSILADLTGFSGMTPEAFVADLRYGMSKWNDLDAYERMAVITERGWIETIVWLESKLIRTIDIQCFEPDEEAEAMAFLHGEDVAPKKPKPGIEAVPTNRVDAYGFRITDRITHEDTKALFAHLADIYQQHDKIDLIVIIDDFEGFEPSLLFDTQTWSTKTASLRHVRKYAVIGGPTWMRASAGFFGSFVPVELKCFEQDEEAQAWAWINAEDASAAS